LNGGQFGRGGEQVPIGDFKKAAWAAEMRSMVDGLEERAGRLQFMADEPEHVDLDGEANLVHYAGVSLKPPLVSSLGWGSRGDIVGGWVDRVTDSTLDVLGEESRRGWKYEDSREEWLHMLRTAFLQRNYILLSTMIPEVNVKPRPKAYETDVYPYVGAMCRIDKADRVDIEVPVEEVALGRSRIRRKAKKERRYLEEYLTPEGAELICADWDVIRNADFEHDIHQPWTTMAVPPPFSVKSHTNPHHNISSLDIISAPPGSVPTPGTAPPAGKAGAIIPQQPSLTTTIIPTQEQPYTTTGTPTVEQVENKLRAHVFAMRIRTADLFKDFDRLRSGLITAAQFRRGIKAVLDKSVLSSLTERDFEILMEHYDRGDRMIRWMEFVDSVDKVFGAKRLEHTPTQYIPAPHEVVKPVRPPLSPDSEALLQDIIARLKSYVKHHGSDVKTWFKDFDKHNNGYITINQFRRGIPQNVLSQEEEDLLMRQYSDDLTGTVNYFKMNTDVNKKVRRPPPTQGTQRLAGPIHEHTVEYVPVGTEPLLHPIPPEYGPNGPDRDAVEDKIRKHVYKDRIRLLEFFRDYDRHNCGLITEQQFRAGLRLSSVTLDEPEIRTLLSVYLNPDRRVRYREFCESIDIVFTINNLEKMPLVDVHPPPLAYLVQTVNQLPAAEEARWVALIGRLRELVKERRLLLLPFFEDFDKFLKTGTSGRVTRSHFNRLLSTMKLDLSDVDLHILFKRYEDKATGYINYTGFLLDVDPDTYHAYVADHPYVAGATADSLEPTLTTTVTTKFITPKPSLEAVMTKLKTHVARQRVRVREFFTDFDKLRSYSIPRQEFIRGVNWIGCPLTEDDYEVLAAAFADEEKTGCCLWKAFEEEIDKVFGQRHLETKPSIKPMPAPVVTNPFPSGRPLAPAEMTMLQKTMTALRDHLKLRQTSIKPFFKDFDKVVLLQMTLFLGCLMTKDISCQLYTGHVTKIQFRQCLTYIKCIVNEEEFSILSKRYLNPDHNLRSETDNATSYGTGSLSQLKPGGTPSLNTKNPIKDGSERICYLTFLDELENGVPELEERHKGGGGAVRRLGNGWVTDSTVAVLDTVAPEVPSGYSLSPAGELLPISDAEVRNLMFKIKIKAKTQRIRVIDFMSDFDHLHHGKITRNEFRRAIKLLYPELTETELHSLELLFSRPPSEGEMVNYQAFSNAIESVFTLKNLEKCPTLEPMPFIVPQCQNPIGDVPIYTLTAQEERTLTRVLNRLIRKVEERRIDALSYLEDFDFVREGTVTTNQYRSALHSIGLPVDDEEIRVLAKRFAATKGMDRINYRAMASYITNHRLTGMLIPDPRGAIAV
ncbi:hypothetical protein HK097_000863, partial [Rhizophlyctis rosea]